MKRAILFLVAALCLILCGKAHAQRALPEMRGLEVRGGMVDGVYNSGNHNKTGYYFGTTMTVYAKNANKWMFGAEFLNRYYPYKDGGIPVVQFTAEGGYFYKFLSDPSKTVFFSLGASALAGYETVNWGKKLLHDGSTVMNNDCFLYGGAITLEIETYLTDRVIFLLSGRERILWGTTAGHFKMQFGIGLRFMIN